MKVGEFNTGEEVKKFTDLVFKLWDIKYDSTKQLQNKNAYGVFVVDILFNIPSNDYELFYQMET